MSHPRQTSSNLDDELKKIFPANDISRWRILEWVKERQKTLAIILGALVIFFIGLTTQSHKEKQIGSKIETYKDEWLAPNSPRDQILAQLEPLLRKHPEGFSGWKGSLMQSALMVGQSAWVEKWQYWPSEKEMIEIPELASLAKASSQAALLSSKESYDQALILVEKTLQEASAASSEAEKMLLSQLYLQKAMLYQKSHQDEKEASSWHELLAFVGADLQPSTRAAELKTPLARWQDQWVRSWSDDKVSLLDYIANRLKRIEK